ncbi:hypothetical protein GRF29_19g671665 [Pseudopithomyces chartarum]|uniref:Uncharacterized protein n=1 Tax=Pseudopithomyces chartarum TaxID=1892770 RepID=A0AAN6M5I9_9PLEO|nr:hypothetical protein GRF29_19g671665 [Pseudopithomyces chartarum]
MAASTSRAPTACPSQIPKRSEGRETRWSAFVPRPLSESCLPCLLQPSVAHPLFSKLIHVSQAVYTDDSHQSEYLRLFNERFPPTTSTSRPSSAHADRDEDEATWLSNIVANSNEAEGSWERVEPIESGALTIQFGEGLSDRKR